jgi:uncharacterized membrane protein
VVALLSGLILGYSALLTPLDPPANWAENIKTNDGYVLFGMLILGVVIGLTNITRKEVSGFLLATIALLVASCFKRMGGIMVSSSSALLLGFRHPVIHCSFRGSGSRDNSNQIGS